jgi:putative transferase (TIGR04331 family)
MNPGLSMNILKNSGAFVVMLLHFRVEPAFMQMKRFLITTADERSWKFDRPVLFLGEWCRLYGRKHIWKTMDAIMARPYGLEESQQKQNLTYVHALADQLLSELATALNDFHHTRHGLRYWHVVLGHWLQRYVATIFNRYHALEQALNEHEVDGTVVLSSPGYHLATNDSISLIYASYDPLWNHTLYSRVLSFFEVENLEVISDGIHELHGYIPETTKPDLDFRRRIQNALFGILTKLSREKDAFIINSYLPFIEDKWLQLSLGQIPQVWKSPKVINSSYSHETRQKFSIDLAEHKGFELFVRLQIGEMIPTCYLEGYGLLVEQANALPWPSRPKFIFTSNNFDTDEVFKVWAASMVEQAVPYFTGQHGSNYGTFLGSQNWPEVVTSDRFFTWGWANGSTKNVPAFVFNTAGRRPQPKAPQGGLLLVELIVTPRILAEDSYFNYGEYQEDQFRFVEALPKCIQQQLTVRLNCLYKKFQWGDEQRWKDRSKNTRLDSGVCNIRDAIADSRLVVFSYDSTGLLECLAMNIPTMCFWQGGLDHLLPCAKPYYELLRKTGILADTPGQAAEMISLRWDNVNEWWESDDVQGARKAFCEQYARVEKNPVKTLKKLLMTHAVLVKESQASACN